MEHPNDKMPGSEMMIYRTEDGLTKIETTFDGDTVWLSADQMAELFQRDNIGRLSCKVQTRYTVSYLGNRDSERVYAKRVCLG